MPEAQVGGPIALVKDGDRIVIDTANRSINWQVDETTERERLAEWEKSGKRPLRERRGVLFRYARDVAVRRPVLLFISPCLLHDQSASEGAYCD